MAEKRFYVDINLKGNELKNFKLQRIDSTGGYPDPAQVFMFFDLSDNRIKYYDGTEWQAIVFGNENGIIDIQVAEESQDYISVDIVDGVATITLNTVDAGTIEHQELSGAGTHDHAAIDAHIDSTSNPHGVTLEQARTANNRVAGVIEMGDGTTNHKITNLADGQNQQDAVTMAQLAAAVAGLKVRDKAQLIAFEALPACTPSGSKEGKTLTANANGALTIDGVAAQANWRIVVNGQANKVDNGIYRVTSTGDASNPWVLTRDGEYDDSPDVELRAGDYFFIQFGTSYNGSGWVLKPVGASHNEDPEVDVDNIDFMQFSHPGDYAPGSAIDITGKTISFKASDAAGKGLKQGSETYELEVENYEPTENTEVSVGRQFDGVSISVGENVLNHNMSGDVIVKVVDQADGYDVELAVQHTSNMTVKLFSNVAFTANISVLRTRFTVV